MQKISSIHSFILELQQIMESCATLIKGHIHIFDHAHSITIKLTFSFLKYVLACKKLDRFIRSLKLSPMPIFDYSHPKIIKVILNFSWISISMQRTNSVHPFIYPFIHPFITLQPGLSQPFLTMPTPIFFYQLLISGINM